jgi:hypothetical protein
MPAFGAALDNVAVNDLVNFLATGEDVAATAGTNPFYLKYRTERFDIFLDPDGYPAVKPPWGTLNAIDLNRGTIRWSVPLGEYPKLAAQGVRDTGTDNYGGAIVTRNGLLIIAATTYDNRIRAFDKRTGKLLWQAPLPAAGNATPSTYMVDGRQYLVIACGGGKNDAPSGGTYVAFALPDDGDAARGAAGAPCTACALIARPTRRQGSRAESGSTSTPGATPSTTSQASSVTATTRSRPSRSGARCPTGRPRKARAKPASVATASSALATIVITALAALSCQSACSSRSSATKPAVPGSPTAAPPKTATAAARRGKARARPPGTSCDSGPTRASNEASMMPKPLSASPSVIATSIAAA